MDRNYWEKQRICKLHEMLNHYESMIVETSRDNPMFQAYKTRYDELTLELRERLENKKKMENPNGR